MESEMEMGEGKKWLGGKREGERATEIKTQEEEGGEVKERETNWQNWRN